MLLLWLLLINGLNRLIEVFDFEVGYLGDLREFRQIDLGAWGHLVDDLAVRGKDLETLDETCPATDDIMLVGLCNGLWLTC